MKKLILPLAVIFITMSSFTVKYGNSEGIVLNDCASKAWTGADEVCADISGGCSSYESWLVTDILYEICLNEME